MAPPTNTTAATAAVLTMNTTQTIADVGLLSSPYEVWFTYGPATTADVLVGWYAAAPAASAYDPVTQILTGTPTDLTPLPGMTAFIAEPIQITLTAGLTYFFRVYHNGSAVSFTDPLGLSLSRAPNDAVPAGALAINDDQPGFPLVFLSATDGTFLQARLFPAGETGTILPDGFSVWHDYDVDPAVFRLYDASLTLRATPAWTFRGASPPVTSNRVDRFYLGDPGGTFPAPTTLARVTTMDTTGALGATVWTLPEVGLRAIGVSHDGAVLYHHGQASGGSSIQRWDLVVNAALAPLAATVAGYQPVKDILVLMDGSILVGYVDTAAPDSFARRYAADGTVLQTYPLGTTRLNRMTFALDDPVSAWLWLFLLSGTALTGFSRFLHVRLSDGVTLTSFDAPRYEGGGYVPAVPAPPPPAPPFGHSPSCPFMVFPPAFPPYMPPGGPPDGGGGGGLAPPYVAPSYDLDARYIRRLRRAPHVAHEQKRVFYRSFELDVERGVGLATGQGSDPTLMLRLSRDGGHTWGEPQLMSAGALGAYTQRAVARRLGHARDTVFEVTVSDPVAWSLVQAWLDLEAGTS